MAAPPIVNSYVCDWLPYRRSNSYFRTLAAATPEDWAGSALTIKADDNSRFAEVAAGAQSTWIPQAMTAPGEVLALLYMSPGLYGGTRVQVTASVHVTIDTTAGTIGGVALPASVWTSSSNYGSAWVRVQNPGGTVIRVRVWSPNEAEPGTWLIDSGSPGSNAALAPGLGHASVTSVSACRWFAYGPADQVTAPRMLTDPGYYNKWFKQAASGAARVLTAEIYVPGYNGSSTTTYTTAVLRVATQAYEGGAAWPYTNQVFAEGLVGWPTLERRLPDDLFGRQQITFGEMAISNPLGIDGKGVRDDWLRCKMQKAIVVLRYGDPVWPWFDHRTILTGEVTEVLDGDGVITVRLRDLMSRYDRPVHRSTLTSGPNSGKPTPVVAGSVFNVSPPVLDSALSTYDIGESNINAVTAVRDKGVLLTDAVVATLVAFDAAADTITTSAPHGRTPGFPITFGAGALPSPLVSGTTYYVKTAPTSTTMTLAATPGGTTIDLTGGGSATIEAAFPNADLLRTSAAHGFAANDAVVFTGSVPAGITAGVTYYVLSSGLASQTFQVSTSVGGAAVNITATTLTVSSVVAALDYEVLSASHGWALNQAFVTEGSHPAPIASQARYFRGTDPGGANFLRFRATSGGADIDITGATTGGTVALAQEGATVTRVFSVSITAPAWVADLSAATLRLGNNPAGQITVDMQGQKFQSVYSASAAHAVKVLIGSGDPLVSTQLGSGTGYDNFNLAVGVWVDVETNLADMLDLLARSCGSVWGCNRIGTLTATAFFDGYAGTPTATITPDAVTQPLTLVRKYLPVDYYEGVRIAYGRNFTVQKDADLAGSVSSTARATYGAQWTYAVNNQGGSGNLAGLDLGEKRERRKRPALETALTVGSVTNANVLRDNLVVGPAKQQAVFELTAKWRALDQYKVARSVSVQSGRFGWGAGKSMLVIGTEESLADHTVKLTLLTDIDGYYPVTT